jgi:hypothetical protein
MNVARTFAGAVLAAILMPYAAADAGEPAVMPQAAQRRDVGELRGTGDLGIAIERAKGSLQWLDTTKKVSLGRIEGLGDLSHASAVFSRDARYAYVFGRDGGLTKADMLTGRVVKRVIQSGNSIGGAISQDGRWIAAANYTPGGVKIFDSETLELAADIPTESKVIGLEDLPGNRFAFSLWDKGEIWLADLADDPKNPKLTKFTHIGTQPYDALISPDGRWYVAGPVRRERHRRARHLEPRRRRQACPARVRQGRGEAPGLQDAAPGNLGHGRQPRLHSRRRPA